MVEDADQEGDDVFFYVNGVERCDEDMAVSKLLAEGVLFVNSRDYMWEGKKEGHTLVCFVNVNDVFAWGTADAESISLNEVGNLYKMYKTDKWGVIKWACIKRNEQPQSPILERMKADGAWDDVMEGLSKNYYDSHRKK